MLANMPRPLVEDRAVEPALRLDVPARLFDLDPAPALAIEAPETEIGRIWRREAVVLELLLAAAEPRKEAAEEPLTGMVDGANSHLKCVNRHGFEPVHFGRAGA